MSSLSLCVCVRVCVCGRARTGPHGGAIYEILARLSVFKHGQPQLRLQLQWPHTTNIIQESSRRAHTEGWVKAVVEGGGGEGRGPPGSTVT